MRRSYILLFLPFLLLAPNRAWSQTPLAVIGHGLPFSQSNSTLVFDNGDVYLLYAEQPEGEQWELSYNVGPILAAGAVPSEPLLFWTWDGDAIKVWDSYSGYQTEQRLHSCGGTIVQVGVAYSDGSDLHGWQLTDTGKLGYQVSNSNVPICFDGPLTPVPATNSSWGALKSRY